MRPGLLWSSGALAGVLAALLVFDAHPGVNWAIWTAFTGCGLVLYLRPGRLGLRTLALPLGFAVVLSAGAMVTTTPLLVLVVFAIVASLLALAIVISRARYADGGYAATDIVTAPVVGLAMTLRGGGSAIVATMELVDKEHDHPALRGSLLAAPVVLVLALLFASADPVLAQWRDTIDAALSAWSGVARLVFGVLVTLFVAGAYFAAWRAGTQLVAPVAVPSPLAPARITEWRIVLGAAAAVCWLFVLLQVAYLFGTTPSMAGSGVSFADYARRGFAELAIAATGSALLIVAAHQRPSPRLRAPSLALLAAVCLVVVSAFHRVNLYEQAYGFTTARVYAQAYMLLTLAVLAVLAWNLTRTFDTRAVARQVMTVALAALAILVFWNGDAWVARANVERYVSTGKIDIGYLTKGLSPDAYPALVSSLPRLAASDAARLKAALQREYSRRTYLQRGDRWFEWNVRRSSARAAIASLGAGAPGPVAENTPGKR